MDEKIKKLPDYVANAGTICQRLWSAVEDLLESSQKLEKALINRDSEEVWEILSHQEKKSSTLHQAAKLWHEVYGENLENLQGDLKIARSEIREKLNRLQLTEKVNYSLTRNYLIAVQNSMVKVTSGVTGKNVGYTKGGKVGIKSSSIIFKSIG